MFFTYSRGSFQNTEDPGEKNTFSSLSCNDYTGELSFIEWIKGRIQKIEITKIVNMVLSVVGGVAAFH